MAAVDEGRRLCKAEDIRRAPQQEARLHLIVQQKYLSGCSAVGSAPALGAGCREFESRHSDHKSRKSICSLGFYLLNRARIERSNATRTSVAADGWTEANYYLRFAQMQTSLATRTKSPESAFAESGLFCLFGCNCASGGCLLKVSNLF